MTQPWPECKKHILLHYFIIYKHYFIIYNEFADLNISKLGRYCLIDLLLTKSGILRLLVTNLPSLNLCGFVFKFCRSKNNQVPVSVRFGISLAFSHCTQKMKFSIKDFYNNCDQITVTKSAGNCGFGYIC